jgi:hypothetical protein
MKKGLLIIGAAIALFVFACKKNDSSGSNNNNNNNSDTVKISDYGKAIIGKWNQDKEVINRQGYDLKVKNFLAGSYIEFKADGTLFARSVYDSTSVDTVITAYTLTGDKLTIASVSNRPPAQVITLTKSKLTIASTWTDYISGELTYDTLYCSR